MTISIRILGTGINRSRLAVNVCPDPALEAMARKSLKAPKKELFGFNEDGVFGACLSENFNGWEDLNDDYPRIDEKGKGSYDKECLQAMNTYIEESVDWALALKAWKKPPRILPRQMAKTPRAATWSCEANRLRAMWRYVRLKKAKIAA